MSTPDELIVEVSENVLADVDPVLADGREAMGDEGCGHTKPGRGCGGFGPRMAPADNDDGIVSHGFSPRRLT